MQLLPLNRLWTFLNIFKAAVVKETLRVSALVTSRLPLMAHDELRYKDWVIPPGVCTKTPSILRRPRVTTRPQDQANTTQTPIGMTPHDVLLDPRIFTEPGKFDPDRWIHDPSLDRYFVAFGKGTRMCQGMRYVIGTEGPLPISTS